MKGDISENVSLSRAERAGIVLLLSSGILFFLNARFFIAPLVVYLVLCLVAPFFPRVGFFLPVISRGKTGRRAVAITFDDGPDPKTTPEILGLLHQHNIHATFFVVGEKASQYPELMEEILARGHSIGNHTYSHDTLVMLKSSKTLANEIIATQKVLKKFGMIPLFFRPPVGITNPKLRPILLKLGMRTMTFSCRAFDGGNRRIKQLSEKLLKKIRPDDIIVLHDIMPKKEFLFSYWLNEIDLIFSMIRQQGFAILPLSQLIDAPVMMAIKGEKHPQDDLIP